MMTKGTQTEDAVWDAWDSLPERQQDILKNRLEGMTLDAVGLTYSLTRERVRQLERDGFSTLKKKLQKTTITSSINGLEMSQIYSAKQLAEIFGTNPGVWLFAAAKVLDFETRVVDVSRLFARSSVAFIELTKALDAVIPCTSEAMTHRLQTTKAFSEIGLALANLSNKAVYVPDKGFVRKSSQDRDFFWLVLSSSGVPMGIDDMAAMVGKNAKAVKAQLLRDHRFSYNRHNKAWELSIWANGQIEINNAFEAVRHVLSQYQSLPQPELIRQASKYWPVSYARYLQVLEDEEFGLTATGEIGLTKNGAVQKTHREPKTTKSITESQSRFFKISLKVDPEMSRGSGIQVPHRLTWVLGMKQPTLEMTFQCQDKSMDHVVVRRTPGSSNISSLKPYLDACEVPLGSLIEIAFDKDLLICQIRHVPASI